MTYEQFWHDNPKLLTVYQKAYYNRLHEEAHLYGYYNYVAVSTALSNAFRKKGAQAEKYIDKPNIDKLFKKPISEKQAIKQYREGLQNQMSWINASSNNK